MLFIFGVLFIVAIVLFAKWFARTVGKAVNDPTNKAASIPIGKDGLPVLPARILTTEELEAKYGANPS